MKNPSAFPFQPVTPYGEPESPELGMTLRDYFAGQALANPTICTGSAPEYQLRNWFGDRGGIKKPEILAKQAAEYADAMLAEREKSS